MPADTQWYFWAPEEKLWDFQLHKGWGDGFLSSASALRKQNRNQKHWPWGTELLLGRPCIEITTKRLGASQKRELCGFVGGGVFGTKATFVAYPRGVCRKERGFASMVILGKRHRPVLPS